MKAAVDALRVHKSAYKHLQKAAIPGQESLFSSLTFNFRQLTSSGVAAVLVAAALGGPVHETLHVFAVFPCEVKKLARRHVCRFFSQKGFKPPAHVGTFPRFQSVAPSSVPVVTQRLKHFLHSLANRSAFSNPDSRQTLRKSRSFRAVHPPRSKSGQTIPQSPGDPGTEACRKALPNTRRLPYSDSQWFASILLVCLLF